MDIDLKISVPKKNYNKKKKEISIQYKYPLHQTIKDDTQDFTSIKRIE